MGYTEWTEHEIKHTPGNLVRQNLRCAQAEIRRLNAPPKDLSDPYPLDGPNVTEQRRWEKLSGWMEALDKRLTALNETVARNEQARCGCVDVGGWQGVTRRQKFRITTLERQMANMRSALNSAGSV